MRPPNLGARPDRRGALVTGCATVAAALAMDGAPAAGHGCEGAEVDVDGDSRVGGLGVSSRSAAAWSRRHAPARVAW